MVSVFEIKGAPCTLCAHFGCQVPGFSYILIPLYKEEHTIKCAQDKTLISNTGLHAAIPFILRKLLH